GVIDILAKVVILAAGGLGTPVILQQSGFKDVGDNLFVDLFVNTYGVSEGLNQMHEPPMTIVNHEFQKNKQFILSPYVNHYRMLRFMENGLKGVRQSTYKMLGIMTKTADDPIGVVLNDGVVSKPLSEADGKRLEEGSSIAKEILVKAGVKSNSVVVSKPQGAHPGGTAAIGQVVDIDLQTKVRGLFVCDASVLPVSPGMPPILTICALGKRLAKTLTG
ncbi:MAG: GMC oxidoreductase, partial [Bacillota bacterium]